LVIAVEVDLNLFSLQAKRISSFLPNQVKKSKILSQMSLLPLREREKLDGLIQKFWRK